MTKDEVISIRNICKCGVANPTTEEELDRVRENRTLRIILDGMTLDEASDFIIWDDDNARIMAIHIGNGTNGGGIIQSAEAYSTMWKSKPGAKELFQVIIAKYDTIFAILSPANRNDVVITLNEYVKTRPADQQEGWQKVVDKYIREQVDPLYDMRTYTESASKDAPFPYQQPVWDDATKTWVIKNPDGTTSSPQKRANGRPWENPQDYYNENTTTR